MEDHTYTYSKSEPFGRVEPLSLKDMKITYDDIERPGVLDDIKRTYSARVRGSFDLKVVSMASGVSLVGIDYGYDSTPKRDNGIKASEDALARTYGNG